MPLGSFLGIVIRKVWGDQFLSPLHLRCSSVWCGHIGGHEGAHCRFCARKWWTWKYESHSFQEESNTDIWTWFPNTKSKWVSRRNNHCGTGTPYQPCKGWPFLSSPPQYSLPTDGNSWYYPFINPKEEKNAQTWQKIDDVVFRTTDAHSI